MARFGSEAPKLFPRHENAARILFYQGKIGNTFQKSRIFSCIRGFQQTVKFTGKPFRTVEYFHLLIELFRGILA